MKMHYYCLDIFFDSDSIIPISAIVKDYNLFDAKRRLYERYPSAKIILVDWDATDKINEGDN